MHDLISRARDDAQHAEQYSHSQLPKWQDSPCCWPLCTMTILASNVCNSRCQGCRHRSLFMQASGLCTGCWQVQHVFAACLAELAQHCAGLLQVCSQHGWQYGLRHDTLKFRLQFSDGAPRKCWVDPAATETSPPHLASTFGSSFIL